MNAKKCKKLRKIVKQVAEEYQETVYHVTNHKHKPPFNQIIMVAGEDNKPTPQAIAHPRVTVKIYEGCARALYQKLKRK